jgi:D-glycero-D-manno-heptose 1,7-bisphosphate phosphatase
MESNPAVVSTVFLDRDGVINLKSPDGEYVTSWQQFQILPGVADAIRKMNDAGLRVLVVSNQRGIALGRCTRADVDLIHAQLQEFLCGEGCRIDRIYFCEHDYGMCDCRKPGIGMFRQAVADFPSIQPESSVMIGDSLSDVDFARNAGIRVMLIRSADSPRVAMDRDANLPDATCNSLAEAADLVLKLARKC